MAIKQRRARKFLGYTLPSKCQWQWSGADEYCWFKTYPRGRLDRLFGLTCRGQRTRLKRLCNRVLIRLVLARNAVRNWRDGADDQPAEKEDLLTMALKYKW